MPLFFLYKLWSIFNRPLLSLPHLPHAYWVPSHLQHGSASPCLLVYVCQAKHEFVKALFPTSWPRCRHRCTSTLATLLWSPTTPSPPPRCWSSPPSSGPTSTPTPSTLLSLRIMISTLRYSYNHRVFSKYCPIIRFKEILKTLKISWSTNDSWITVYELKFTLVQFFSDSHPIQKLQREHRSMYK